MLRNKLTWCWNSNPDFMDYARRFRALVGRVGIEPTTKGL